MPLPHVFATQPAGTVAASFLDDNFNALGNGIVIPCTATGTNAIALSPLTNYPTISSYSNYFLFSFVAAATSTGPVTVNVSGVGALNLYLSTGSQATTGQISSGVLYLVAYNLALNSGSGGFAIVSATVGAQISGTPTAGHAATWLNATTLQDGGAIATLHAQTFTGSGTFVIPSAALSTTAFKITAIGGGGGGAGAGSGSAASGGGSGGAITTYFTGFTASANVTVTIGGGGTGGGSGVAGNPGTATTVVYSSATLITANGGGGGNPGFFAGGAAATATAASGGGATLAASYTAGAQNADASWSSNIASNGGSNAVGSGGLGTASSSTGNNGASGAGGGGCVHAGGGTGGNGGNGIVIVEWVL